MAADEPGEPVRPSPPVVRYDDDGKSATLTVPASTAIIHTLDGSAPSSANGTRSEERTLRFALGGDAPSLRVLAIAVSVEGDESLPVEMVLPRRVAPKQHPTASGSSFSAGGKSRTYSSPPAKGWSATGGGGGEKKDGPRVRLRPPMPRPDGKKWVIRTPEKPTPRVNAPTIVPKGGSFPKGERVQVRLLCITPGATIIYTLNGGEPSRSNGIRVTSGHTFTLSDGNAAVKAVAVKDGMKDSISVQGLFTRKKGK